MVGIVWGCQGTDDAGILYLDHFSRDPLAALKMAAGWAIVDSCGFSLLGQ